MSDAMTIERAPAVEPADARSPAYIAGHEASQYGLTLSDNPQKAETEPYRDWKSGWEMARIHNLHFAFVRKQVGAPPAWSADPVKAWEDVYSRDMAAFVIRDYWTDTGSVNVFRVVGTCHADYQHRTWLEFLTAGKRMPHNLQYLIDNPDYYLAPGPRRPRIDYCTLDGLDFYVGSDGNHRTCLSRFFLGGRGDSQLHDVTVHHHQVDWVFYDAYRRLRDAIRDRQVLAVVDADRRLIGRDDTAGWKIDRYAPFIIWRDLDTGDDSELDRDQAQDKLVELAAHTPWARREAGASLGARLKGMCAQQMRDAGLIKRPRR